MTFKKWDRVRLLDNYPKLSKDDVVPQAGETGTVFADFSKTSKPIYVVKVDGWIGFYHFAPTQLELDITDKGFQMSQKEIK